MLKNLSGFSWSDEKGLNIAVEEEQAFRTYVAVRALHYFLSYFALIVL